MEHIASNTRDEHLVTLGNGPEEREEPVQVAEEGSLIEFDLRVLTQFRNEEPHVTVLSDIGTACMALYTFKAGQQLQNHTTSSQLIVQVLRGRITLATTSSSVRLQAGKLVQLEASIPHNITAQTDAVMLLIMTPSPTYHSLGLHYSRPLVTRAGTNA